MARGVLLFFVLSAIMVTSTLAVCCSNHGWFTCCREGGTCNLFCCNCDSCKRRCDFDPFRFDEIPFQKRSATFDDAYLNQSKAALKKGGGDVTLSKFHFIDVNGDGVIDLKETMAYALAYGAESEINSSSAHGRQKRSASIITRAFKEMDANGDGNIDMEEFDHDLKK